MSQCKHCQTTENIVYSGVAALLLGIPGAETETSCYECAKKNQKTIQEQEATNENK